MLVMPNTEIKQPLQDLGCVNGMLEDSLEKEKINNCWKLKHHQNEYNIGTCYNRYTCRLCNITFTIDSSD